MKLNGSVVLITGASAGIGKACAFAFAAEGARLLLAARRVERIEALRGKLTEAGAADLHALGLDVRDRAAVEKTLGGCLKNGGLSMCW